METNESTPILCGTDFSENAKQAATAAAFLAARLGKPLLLVHVAALSGLSDDQKELDARSPALKERLEFEAERLRESGASIETKILAGQLAENAIRELGEEHSASLIVVSSVSKTAFSRWTLGSVSESLAQRGTVPTLIVRDAAPFVAWARGQRTMRVFVGTDFTASSEAALRWVAALRQFGPIEVLAGYVDWPPQEASRLGFSGELKIGGDLPKMQQMIERDLRESVTRILGEDHVSVHAVGSWGRPDMPLVDMALKEQADLVVVGTHQWSGLRKLWHGSVSRGILRHAPMSVVCVPAVAMAEPRVRECLRVLVAVDLNEPHRIAASYAYSIIQPGGTVRLIYNMPPLSLLEHPLVDDDDLESSKLRGEPQRVTEAKAQLRALAPHEAEERGITTEVEVTQKRKAAKEICAAAERFNADIVCIGGHTRPGPIAKAMGSVSFAVLRGSRRPVLVVWSPPDHLS